MQKTIVGWTGLLACAAAFSGCATADSEPSSNSAAQAVTGTLTPSGPYTDWSFSQDLYNLDSHTVVDVAPAANVTEFWSTQFWFKNGNGGYMGIQNAGELPGGGTGKIAIASIWGATGARAISGSCLQFNEGGTGYSCRLAYNWVAGHDYRSRAWVVSPGVWVFAIADMNTGVEYQLGEIDVPGSWGWIDPGDIINWTEYFAANSPGGLLVHCSDLPLVEASFSLKGNDNTLSPLLLDAHVANASCHNTVEGLVNATTVKQDFGGANNSWLSPGQSLSRGQAIWSEDGASELVHQTDGNVVVYHKGVPLWATKTAGKSTSVFAMQTDGNLVLYSPTNVPLWNSGTEGRRITSLTMQSDCNLVLYENGGAVWQSMTYNCVSRL